MHFVRSHPSCVYIVDFQETLRHLAFLAEVDSTAELKRKHVLLNALRRYERLWLPLIGRFQNEATLEPPLDVAWVWHTHMLGRQFLYVQFLTFNCNLCI